MHHHLHPTNSFMDEYITQNYAYVMLFLIMMVFITGFVWKMVRDERGH